MNSLWAKSGIFNVPFADALSNAWALEVELAVTNPVAVLSDVEISYYHSNLKYI